MTASTLPYLSQWQLFTLSIGMAGAQVAWTVELGYGTPFLLSLGLSEQLTSLVWLAGPISGLVAQPLIGAISDASTSRYRRRLWIVWSTVVLVVSCIALAYAESMALLLVHLFGGGAGVRGPTEDKQSKNVAIGLAVAAFYLLDFSLNALQASLRNLLLDVAPPRQLSAGNAWHGRMTHAGNIVGYGFGFLNLAGWPILRSLGGNQFRKFCLVGIVIIVITVWITCWTQDEPQNTSSTQQESGLRDIIINIRRAIINLPVPIRKVCLVQLFAFMAWFPFLFYATTYIGQIMARQDNRDPSVDVATRLGNLAMLLYSIVAAIAGTLLPQLTRRDLRLLQSPPGENEETEYTRIQQTVSRWKTEAVSHGKKLTLPRMPVALRDVWSFALILYGLICLATFFIDTLVEAIIAVALVGICWAVASWAPYAMIMEFLKEVNEASPNKSGHRGSSDAVIGATSSHTTPEQVSERSALLNDGTHNKVEPEPIAGGTVLGIHNLAIVFPQFVVALVASLIFRIVDKSPDIIGLPETIYLGKNGVAWVLRFGGLSAFVGAVVAQWIPPTEQEKRMRQQLRLMREAHDYLRTA
ncbi:hypothetical protein BU17DRAFT_37242 [Hysterangium stoloniferum]|nr:hypothetical protein BU17DRAFT_37242 [Hysterangium stoloniferum]